MKAKHVSSAINEEAERFIFNASVSLRKKSRSVVVHRCWPCWRQWFPCWGCSLLSKHSICYISQISKREMCRICLLICCPFISLCLKPPLTEWDRSMMSECSVCSLDGWFGWSLRQNFPLMSTGPTCAYYQQFAISSLQLQLLPLI